MSSTSKWSDQISTVSGEKLRQYAKMRIDAYNSGNTKIVHKIYEDKNFDDEEYAANMYSATGKRGSMGTCWCFTWNNYPKDHKEVLENLRSVEYMIYGYEICPSTETPHLQGFVKFTCDQRYGTRNAKGYHLNSLKGRLFGMRWAKMYIHSSPQECSEYCEKHNLYITRRGVLAPGRGQSAKLNDVAGKIMRREITLDECDEQHPGMMVAHGRGLTALHARHEPPRNEHPCAVYIYGPTGTGKSKYAKREHGEENVYRKTNGNIYWNNYNNELATVIEEFTVRGNNGNNSRGWLFEDLILVLDQYKIAIDIKFGATQCNSKYIYITSPYHLKHHFPKEEEFMQIIRRLNMIYHIPAKGAWPVPDLTYKDYYWSDEKNIDEPWGLDVVVQYKKEHPTDDMPKSIENGSNVEEWNSEYTDEPEYQIDNVGDSDEEYLD